jgi:hypothetical protein
VDEAMELGAAVRTGPLPSRPPARGLLALLLVLAACAGNGAGGSPPPTVPTVDVADVAAHDGELVVLEGSLLAAPEAVHRLCDALAESYPPQCAGTRVEVVGLELARLADTETNLELPEGERTVWSDRAIRLTGTLEDDRLVLVRTAARAVPGAVVVEARTEGRAVVGATIELWGGEGVVRSARTDDLGVAVLPAPDGDVRVVALPAGGLAPPGPRPAAAGDAVILDYAPGSAARP